MFDNDADQGLEAEDDLSSTYLTFDLCGQTLGVEVRHVRQILDRQRLTRLPNAPMQVEGIVDLRGKSVPILDLNARLGMPMREAGDDERIVVLEIAGSMDPIGIFADRVRNVETIPPGAIEKVPSAGLGGWDASELLGLYRRGEDLIVLLDITRIYPASVAEIDFSAGAGFF